MVGRGIKSDYSDAFAITHLGFLFRLQSKIGRKYLIYPFFYTPNMACVLAPLSGPHTSAHVHPARFTVPL